MSPWQQCFPADMFLLLRCLFCATFLGLWIYIWWSSCPFSPRSSLSCVLSMVLLLTRTLKTRRNTTKNPEQSSRRDFSQHLSSAGLDGARLPGGMYGSIAFAWTSTAIFIDCGIRGRVLPDGHFSLADIFSLCLRRCDLFIFTGSQLKSSLTCRSLHAPPAAAIGPAGHGLKYRWASGKATGFDQESNKYGLWWGHKAHILDCYHYPKTYCCLSPPTIYIYIFLI